MSGLKLSTNATMAIIIIAGLVYLGFAFDRDPSAAAAQLPLVLGGIAGAIKLLYQGDTVEQKAEEAKAQSRDNAVAIDQTLSEVKDNTAKTEATHGAVNGQMAEFRQSVQRTAQLEVLVAEMQAKLDSALARADGITEGRSQVIGDAVTVEPQADGTILVEAPAVIHVVTPDEEPQP